MTRGHTVSRRALVLVLLCVISAVVVSFDELHSVLIRVVAAAGELMNERPVLGAVLFVVFAAVSALLAFFSTGALVPVAVYSWGKPLCMLALWVGWTLGGMVTYGLGRSLGRPLVRPFVSTATLSRYQARISTRTPFGLVLLFQLALPSEVPGYLLGLARYPFWKYLAALMLAESVYAVGTVYLGASFLDRQVLVFIGVGAAGALVMALAFHLLHRRLHRES